MRPRRSTRSERGSGGRNAGRDREVLEQRRLEAGRLFRQEVWPAEVARRLGVSRQSATRWHHDWQESGSKGLRKVGTSGRPSQLTAAGVRRVRNALMKEARANGFSTDLWTVDRVTEVIAKVTGVEYHPGQVWKLLGRLGWSLAEAGSAGHRVRRRGGPALGARGVAADKNPPAGSGPGSSSRMRAAPR
jgi:transposase